MPLVSSEAWATKSPDDQSVRWSDLPSSSSVIIWINSSTCLYKEPMGYKMPPKLVASALIIQLQHGMLKDRPILFSHAETPLFFRYSLSGPKVSIDGPQRAPKAS